MNFFVSALGKCPFYDDIKAYKTGCVTWRQVVRDVCSNCCEKAVCKLISYRIYAPKNVIVNTFLDDVEIIVFKKDLVCIEDSYNISFREKSGYINIDGLLFPKNENQLASKFLENMERSNHKSLDRFYGYALSNDWEWFVTLTTDKLKVNRYDDDAVKKLWSLCRRKLQRYDKNIKCLFVPERHKNGALHFHGFLTFSKAFSEPLKLYRDPKTGEYKSSYGVPLFEFPFWDYGIATFAPIPREDTRRVANYISGYITKRNDIGYGKKRFYRTQNLNFKEKEILNLKATDINKKLEGFAVYKDTKNFTIYRKKN